MRYILYSEDRKEQGRYNSVYDLRKFLSDRKYETDCDKDIGDTFDYIRSIGWSFDIDMEHHITRG